MPIYDYRCEECEHDFWLIESLFEHDKERHVCPSCGSKRVRRVISAANVHTTRKS